MGELVLRVVILRIDKLTMEPVGAYGSYSECAKEVGKERGYIIRCVKDKAVSKGRYIYRDREEFDPNESFNGKRNRPLIVTDTKTGKSYAVEDTHWLAQRLGTSAAQVRKAICGGARLRWRFKVKYLR